MFNHTGTVPYTITHTSHFHWLTINTECTHHQTTNKHISTQPHNSTQWYKLGWNSNTTYFFHKQIVFTSTEQPTIRTESSRKENKNDNCEWPNNIWMKNCICWETPRQGTVCNEVLKDTKTFYKDTKREREREKKKDSQGWLKTHKYLWMMKEVPCGQSCNVWSEINKSTPASITLVLSISIKLTNREL